VLALSFAAPVAAGTLEDGVAANDSGDYATALRLWRPLADQGTAAAQNSLGFMCDTGRGVPKDYVLAYMWSNLAALRYSGEEKQDGSRPSLISSL